MVLLAPRQTRRFQRVKGSKGRSFVSDERRATAVARGGDSILHLRCTGGFEHGGQVDNPYTADGAVRNAGSPVFFLPV